jgi:thymidylate kinase
MQGGKAGALIAKQKGHDESLTVEQIFSIGNSLLPKLYMEPNGLILLSLSHSTRRSRMNEKAVSHGLDKIESRTLEYSDAVHDAYISFESALAHATVIDAEQSPEDLFTQARPLLFGPTHA